MSLFASVITQELDLEGSKVVIHKLSHLQLLKVEPLFKDDVNQWSREMVRIGVVTVDGSPLTDEQLEDLTDEAIDEIGMAVMKLTKPALFVTKDEAEVEQKND